MLSSMYPCISMHGVCLYVHGWQGLGLTVRPRKRTSPADGAGPAKRPKGVSVDRQMLPACQWWISPMLQFIDDNLESKDLPVRPLIHEAIGGIGAEQWGFKAIINFKQQIKRGLDETFVFKLLFVYSYVSGFVIRGSSHSLCPPMISAGSGYSSHNPTGVRGQASAATIFELQFPRRHYLGGA